MKDSKDISISVIKRLPRYYRFLDELRKLGVARISSRELSDRMGFTASQIRQDFNCFGGFGQQGYGYNVEQLYFEIGKILGIGDGHRIILIGAGNLGRAIASHMEFDKRGFSLIGIFDAKQTITGQMVRGLPVRHIDGLDEFCRENLPEAAILCVSPEAAKEMVDQLLSLGIKAFWNFSHYDIAIEHPNVQVENVHLSDSLMTLCYKMHSDKEN